MLNRNELMKNYWDYYLALENRFVLTTNYVSIDKDNMNTFSNEYALLYQAIGGELDSFFKEYCGFAHNERKSISDYAKIILNDYSDIGLQEIIVLGSDLIIKPFEGWKIEKPAESLSWWKAYDEIKHSRYINKKQANQNNVISILGALFLMEMKYLKVISEKDKTEIDTPDRSSALFSLKGWDFKHIPLNGAYAVIDLNK